MLFYVNQVDISIQQVSKSVAFILFLMCKHSTLGFSFPSIMVIVYLTQVRDSEGLTQWLHNLIPTKKICYKNAQRKIHTTLIISELFWPFFFP